MLRVVLADDENKVILLMQKLIDWEALGYEIAGTANDGLRALELVREKQPHLLITDVRMPGCDGIELIQRAKALLIHNSSADSDLYPQDFLRILLNQPFYVLFLHCLPV